jgi:phage replication-related protein YjqB (UPF0714/DUF867 family)
MKSLPNQWGEKATREMKGFVALAALVFGATCVSSGPSDGDLGGTTPGIGRFALGTKIDVLKAKTEMLEYLTEENCTIDDELRVSEGLAVGEQFLLTVYGATSKYGLVTIHSDYEDGTDNDDIRMRLSGRQRFDQSDAFDAYIDPWTALQGKTDSWLNDNDQMGEFKQESSSSQTDMLIMAPHGGAIESYTDELAARFYDGLVTTNSKDASLWYCIGHQDAIGAFDAWHITSTDINEANFGYLNDLSGRTYDYAVTVHGYSGSEVLVGGGASTSFKEDVKDALDAISWSYTVTVVGAGDSYAGVDPDNIVNRYSSTGVQLELPYSARRDYWEDIADALVGYYKTLI